MWICSKGRVHEDFTECDCSDEKQSTEGEEDSTGITTCSHNWIFKGTGTMPDPSTGRMRKVRHSICSKCQTGKTEWA